MQKIIAAIIMIAALAVAGTAGAAEWTIEDTGFDARNLAPGDIVYSSASGEYREITGINLTTDQLPVNTRFEVRPSIFAEIIHSPGYISSGYAIGVRYLYVSDFSGGVTSPRVVELVKGGAGCVASLATISGADLAVAGTAARNGQMIMGAASTQCFISNSHFSPTFSQTTTPVFADNWTLFSPDFRYVVQGTSTVHTPADPTDPTPAATDCTGATTDLERGTCNGRETMTSEGRTGIIVGLDVY